MCNMLFVFLDNSRRLMPEKGEIVDYRIMLSNNG